MGSGETTATMVPVHRSVLERFPTRPLVAVVDTPYGFQENADELTRRTRDYFRTSLPMADITVASLRSLRLAAPDRERALDALRRADVVFAGPGSPSYALRVWQETPVPGILRAKLAGGALTMASAASITLGRFSLPVYEIYKVGADPFWLPGLDILGEQAIPAVVVPHWNNAEGGTHDTSRCWLGLRRFAGLVAELPPGLVILGVDEHTAVVLDFDAGRLEVAGKGTVTRIAGAEAAVLGPGDTMPLSFLAAGSGAPAVAFPEAGSPPAETAAVAGDTPDDTGRARAVEALLGVRSRARDDGRWADADAIRRALRLLAVEVRDTPEGTVWGPVPP